MSKKVLAVVIAAACVSALSAGPARAASGHHATIAFNLAPDLAGPVSCPDSLFGFALDLTSLGGRPLGTGQSCVDSIHGCDPFVAFCRRTVHATLTLELPRGSLTVPTKLLEVLPTELSFIQAGRGEVRSGTGAYAAATGRVAGGGSGAFDEQFTFTGRLIYVADLNGVR
jgi:hypothetical protein